MSEFAKPLRSIALATTLGLGLAACGSSKSAEGGHSNPPAPKVATAVPSKGSSLPNVEVKYFSNGARELIFDNIDGAKALDEPYGGMNAENNILQFCDGSDLVEEIVGSNNSVTTPITRTEKFGPCIVGHGMLTPIDFPPSPNETIVK